MSRYEAEDRVRAALDDLGAEVHSLPDGSLRARGVCHGGTNNSTLSIRYAEADDDRPVGRVLLRCHSGCEQDQIVAALGLTFADLYDGPTPAGPGRVEREHPYLDGAGRIVGVVRRYGPDKTFRPITPTSTGWAMRGNDTLPSTIYRLPEVMAGIANRQPVYVTEGEADADALVAHGLTATTNAGGSGKWTPLHARLLLGADVVVCRDRDEAGRRHAAEVVATLDGIARSVTLVEPAQGKDVREHLAAGRTLDELVTVERDDSTVSPLVDRYPPVDWTRLWATTTDEPVWIVRDVFERGRSHALFSPAKAGKSLLLLDLVAALVSGRDVLGEENPLGPQTVLYVDLENTLADLRQRFDAMGYGPDDLAGLIYLSFPTLPPLDTAAGGVHLAALAEHHHPVLIVLDTVSRVVAGEENSADTFRALYRHTLGPLKAAGLTLVRLDHEGKDPTAGQRGSSAKVDDVDTVWRLTPRGDGRLTLRCDRQRSGHHPETLELTRRTDPTLVHLRLDAGEDRPEVARLVAELDRLDVAPGAGRPTCRAALARAGVRASNVELGEAIAVRRRPLELSRTASPADDLQKIANGCPQDQDESTVSPDQSCPGQVPDSGDSGPFVPLVAPVPDPVPPGRGQVGIGAADRPTTDHPAIPGKGPCDVCGCEPAVPFGEPWFVRRCLPHHPLTWRAA